LTGLHYFAVTLCATVHIITRHPAETAEKIWRDYHMGVRRMQMLFRKSGGVLLAVAGMILVVKVLPLYLWPLALGAVLIWVGWQLYIYDRYY
jgi:sterol desaturase/sphingolipid hydroxylase (fatty acid hydroxylase superfamily)